MSASSAILGLGILRFVCLEPRRGRAPQLGSGTSTLPQGVAAQQLTKSMEASGFNQQTAEGHKQKAEIHRSLTARLASLRSSHAQHQKCNSTRMVCFRVPRNDDAIC